MNENAQKLPPNDAAPRSNGAARLAGLGLGVAAVSALSGGLAGVAAAKGLALAKGAAAAHTAGYLPAAAPAAGWSGKWAAGLRWIGDNALTAGVGALSGGLAGYFLAAGKLAASEERMDGCAAVAQAAAERTAQLAGAVTDLRERERARADEATRVQAALSELETCVDALKNRRKTAAERLEDIHGIGEIYAERLRAAGIETFGQLAASTVERVREIVGRGSHLTNDNIKGWIEEAAALAV